MHAQNRAADIGCLALRDQTTHSSADTTGKLINQKSAHEFDYEFDE